MVQFFEINCTFRLEQMIVCETTKHKLYQIDYDNYPNCRIASIKTRITFVINIVPNTKLNRDTHKINL